MKSVSIIVPLLNEEQSINKFHEELKNSIKVIQNYQIQIKYILDKSDDNTKLILTEIVKNCNQTSVICLSNIFGHQHSLIAGIDQSLDQDIIIMMDGDLQHPPSLIQRMLKEYEQGFDVVNTIRLNYKKFSFLKSFFSNIFYSIFKFLTSQNIKTGSADFRLISKKVSQIISSSYREKNIFLRGVINLIGLKQTHLTYQAHERLGGFSKYNFIKSIFFALQSTVAFGAKPLYFCFFVGLSLMLISFIVIIYFLIIFLLGSDAPSGWYTIIILIFFFSGLNLLFLGIIGLYLGASYEEIKKRPLYIIEDIIKKN